MDSYLWSKNLQKKLVHRHRKLFHRQVVSAVDVAVGAADAWVDVMPLLPSVLSNVDTNSLLSHILAAFQKKGQWSNAQVTFKTFVGNLKTEKSENKNVNTFDKNLKTFNKNLKTFNKNLKTFYKNLKTFEKSENFR